MVSDENNSTLSHGQRLALIIDSIAMIGAGSDNQAIGVETGLSGECVALVRETLNSFTKTMRFKHGKRSINPSEWSESDDASALLAGKMSQAFRRRLRAHALVEPTALDRLLSFPPLHPIEAPSLVSINGQILMTGKAEMRLVRAVCEIFALPASQYALVVRGMSSNSVSEMESRIADQNIPGERLYFRGHGQPFQLEAKKRTNIVDLDPFETREYGFGAYVALLSYPDNEAVIRKRFDLVVALVALQCLHLGQAPVQGYTSAELPHIPFLS